ncbi:MAG: DUF2461 domain-containing protein [Marinilabiliaceae bacterium]|nr:DUF2461 domain-containing protein [Marinilabiliaceae bacterium]
MKQIIDFLKRLGANNNRTWFLEHKAEYQEAKERFDAFTEELISRVAAFDPTIRGLTAKDCTYRIYRDVRFSTDKSPYKTHMACYICRGGKKSGYSGYYFHVAAEEGNSYPKGHMLAVGDYCMEPKALQILREDIMDGDGDFERILMKKVDSCFILDKSFQLKRPPKGYDENTPYIDLIKYKAFCLCYEPQTEEILSPNIIDIVAERFRTTKPFLDYINRSIEYVKDGNCD